MSLSLQASAAGSPHDERASLHRQWGLIFALGLASVIVGLVAIAFAVIATLVKVIVIGILLLIAGVTEVVHAFMARNGRGFALHLLAAALYLFVGVFVIEDPVRAASVLTLLLVAAFLVGGLLRVFFSLGATPPGWPWVLLNGVVDVILAALIWSEWPESSLWVIGLFVGIELIFHGWSWMGLALAVRSYNPAIPAPGNGLAGSVGGTEAGHFRS
jgi:uncharacterized membrane protein HdeD (DUF308 family)